MIITWLRGITCPELSIEGSTMYIPFTIYCSVSNICIVRCSMLTFAIQCSASLQTYWQVDKHRFASDLFFIKIHLITVHTSYCEILVKDSWKKYVGTCRKTCIQMGQYNGQTLITVNENILQNTAIIFRHL